MKESNLQEDMITDAIIILQSVGFLEKEIFKKLSLLEECFNNDYAEDAPLLKSQLQFLLKKIDHENYNMSAYMAKYRKKVQDEKKGILSHTLCKERPSYGGLPS